MAGAPVPIDEIEILIDETEYTAPYMDVLNNSTTYSLEFKLKENIHKVEFYMICRKVYHSNMVQKCVLLPNPNDSLCGIRYKNIVGYGTDNIEKSCSSFYAGDNKGNSDIHFEYEDLGKRRMCENIHEININNCTTKKCEFDNGNCS